MKKAFTLFEIVVVIIVIGIMAAFVAPKFSRDDLRLAADQIAAHIRYTQHLAMIDDKYDPGNAYWYKKRWIFEFTNINTQKKIKGVCENTNCWRYNVYSDESGSTNLNSIDQAAKDPENSSKRLTAGFSPGSLTKDALKKLNLKLNLTYTYNINTIEFRNGCQASRNNVGIKIRFDELGRPYNGNPDIPYGQWFVNEIGKVSPCTIILTHKNNSTCTINVEPETGYVTIRDCGSN
ncbi:carbamoyl-phosphate synthase large subunit [Campylobacter hyointestinalis]|uniref:pilus assembly FimT family protein n=1 Tax=Campylobacter hyointestinalis TaxID=198 RepID=UPI0007C8D6E5|nr:prepilin-type N-terminal cleavage/methylation domain-containing protein [Campylobacter hyointestinalis]ANE32201.1 putative type II secretion system protein [Campylobacter hyointestinalis subsp. hyointestinalis LMG 9260]TXK46850.1 prepilin-type N-terminal cleavage/methylation domain-containing protein [Campylobacter hyointestinalis]SFT65126.1 prepilin-type N-terminal cleavage/methylation domain-containing protein [Campylobacter hyointestinalis]SUW88323.1 carbamoyl-phosphate synthase large sub